MSGVHPDSSQQVQQETPSRHLNGFLPVSMKQKMAPRLNTSVLGECSPLPHTSGAIQPGVPASSQLAV